METYLSDDFLRQLTAAGEVDILVSVPTANNRQSIEHVINAIQIGLAKYFPRERAALMNPDANSRDGTQEIVKATAVRDFRSYLTASPLRSLRTLTTSYHPSRGQAGALRLIMAAADLLRAKACVVLSPDVTSLTPEWIDGLVRPVLCDGFDLLTPIYQRHRFEGLLVRNLLSPLVGAAYGWRLEEPAPSEAAFSGKLASFFLVQNVWQEDFMRYGAPIWMTTAALAQGFRAGQSFMGPKIYPPKRAAEDLVSTIQHFVGAVFQSLEMYETFWTQQTAYQSVPILGFPTELDLGPARLNRKKLFEMFQSGTREIASILEQVLSASTLQEVLETAKQDDTRCWFPDELWVKTVYEFAAAYHRRVMNRDHLLQALTPVYRGRISSYLRENRGSSMEQLRERRGALQTEYERLKPGFIESWTAKT